MAVNAPHGLGLRGRRGERETLDRLVADVRAGKSGVLVVRGEAGVGKSALLGYLVERPSGCGVARAAGVESEMELAYAGLHQLCAPLLDRVDRLPGPQRDALATAFGMSTGEPPDRFLVGLAVLNLLADVADDRPLVCVVDDAQWLDRVSAQTLAFVARRLLAEQIALVFGVREPSDNHEFEGLPELAVRGLSDADARALLDEVISGPVDQRVHDRIVAETRGNPLALLELPRGLTPAELAFGFGTPEAMPLAGRIEPGFLAAPRTASCGDPTAPARGGGRTGRRRRRRARSRPRRPSRAQRHGASAGIVDEQHFAARSRSLLPSAVPAHKGGASGVRRRGMPQIRCARIIDAPFRARIWCRSRPPSVTACVTMSCEMPSLQPEPDQRRATRVWHLAMARRDQLRAARDPGRDVRVEVAQVPFGPLNRFFYLEIGSEFHWVDRRGWTGARWQRHAVGVTTWLVHDHGTPAGYAELQRHPDVSIDVAFFGLLAPFRGRGLGGHLLTRAVGDAWDMGARRVTVNTCELDGPYALSHYRARGFEIIRERIEERPLLF